MVKTRAKRASRIIGVGLTPVKTMVSSIGVGSVMAKACVGLGHGWLTITGV